MKTIVSLHNISLLVIGLLFAGQAMAGDPLVEKKKTYSKSYALSASDKVTLSNKFGELKINTWNKNEVQVEVTITAEAGTDERAQHILDNIQIQDSKNGNEVSFVTKTSNNNQKAEKGEKQSFSVNYVVNMPARNALKAMNEFGNLLVPDMEGETELLVKFGKLTAGRLKNPKSVTLEFCSGSTVESLNSGTLTVKFSKAQINNASGEITANFEYSGAKLVVDNNLKGLTIKNNFSDLKLDVETNFSANFNITTNFSEVKNKTSFPIKDEDEGKDENDHTPKFKHSYSGKSGSGSASIKVKAEFGEVTIGHDLPFNVNEDDKKGKKKTTNI